jgi:hypothetical protein
MSDTLIDNRVVTIGMCLIIALQVCGCTTTHQGDPVIGTWIYRHEDSRGDREITYTFNSSGRYDATDFDYSYQFGPHSSGPKFGSWKTVGNNEYLVIDEAGFAGEPPDPFVYSPEKDVLTRHNITFVRKPGTTSPQ